MLQSLDLHFQLFLDAPSHLGLLQALRQSMSPFTELFLDAGFCYLNSLWMAVNFDPSFPFFLQEIKFIVEFIIKMMMKTFTYSSLSNSRHLRTISVLTALWLLNSFVLILKMTDQDSKSEIFRNSSSGRQQSFSQLWGVCSSASFRPYRVDLVLPVLQTNRTNSVKGTQLFSLLSLSSLTLTLNS